MTEPDPPRRRRSPLMAVAGLVAGAALALGIVRATRGGAQVEPDAYVTAIGGAALAEDRGTLDEVVVHYVRAFEPLFATAYRDFLGSLPPTTRLLVIAARPEAEGGAPASDLDAFLGRIDPSGALGRRARVVEVDGPISIWSKDRALVLAPKAKGERSILAVPVKPDPAWRERANDWSTPAAIAAAEPDRFEVRGCRSTSTGGTSL